MSPRPRARARAAARATPPPDRVRPQVVAHRGASHDRAEHTLSAYVEALDTGAEALECDVRLTADGHLVCVHDRNLRRTAQARRIVSTMDLADLDQLDFAAWKNPWADMDEDAPERDDDEGRVLTLRRLLETVADYDRHVEVAIETKHPTRYAGLVERRVVDLITEFGWERAGSPVRVMSFSWTALQRVERWAPGVQLVQLLDKAEYWPMLRGVIGDDWIVGPGIRELEAHPRLGERIRRSGHQMHVWTVNTRAELELCLDLGVRAVISDRPGYVLDLLDRPESGTPGAAGSR